MSVSEIITDGGRRRHWRAAEKPRIVEETLGLLLARRYAELPDYGHDGAVVAIRSAAAFARSATSYRR